MLSHGELILIKKILATIQNVVSFSLGEKNVDCDSFNELKKDNSLAMWHAGGNWGDLWGINIHRIQSFLPMLQKNMTIFGMPQSLHYNNDELKQKKADELKKIIEKKIGTVKSKNQIVLTWRQDNSYNEALHLYPFVDNPLVPDIAFMIGPIKNTKYWTIPSTNEVDLLFVQ